MLNLDGLFGRYLRGDLGVYRGKVTAHDTRGLYGPDYTDRTMASGAAIASLLIYGTDPQATLTIFSPSENESVFFSQLSSAPGVTTVLGIFVGAEYGGATPTCTGCVPDLFAQPRTIAWADQDTVTAVTTPTGVTAAYHVVSSVNLQVASPCSLTWDEIAALDATTANGGGDVGLGDFVAEGASMVWRAKAGRVATAAPSQHGACDGQYIPYTIDLYVNLADLSDYGVRNYVAGVPVAICAI